MYSTCCWRVFGCNENNWYDAENDHLPLARMMHGYIQFRCCLVDDDELDDEFLLELLLLLLLDPIAACVDLLFVGKIERREVDGSDSGIAGRGNDKGKGWRSCLRYSSTGWWRCESTRKENPDQSTVATQWTLCPIECAWTWRRAEATPTRMPPPRRPPSAVPAVYSAEANRPVSLLRPMDVNRGSFVPKSDDRPRRNWRRWPEEERRSTASNGWGQSRRNSSTARATLRCTPNLLDDTKR